jgi:hypothetical protein
MGYSTDFKFEVVPLVDGLFAVMINGVRIAV